MMVVSEETNPFILIFSDLAMTSIRRAKIKYLEERNRRVQIRYQQPHVPEERVHLVPTLSFNRLRWFGTMF